MKSVGLMVLALFFSWYAPRPLNTTDTGGSANGTFRVTVENGPSRDITFDAKVATDGSTTGDIVFRDQEPIVVTDKSKPADETSKGLPPFYAKASCDCLVVKGTEAVISGTVTESSREDYIGRRVLLVVEDGDSLTPPVRDKLTFGFYKTRGNQWVATDSERGEEQGPPPTWVATDAERPDDVGILSTKSDEVTCRSFPIASHSFLNPKQGKGKIQITP